VGVDPEADRARFYVTGRGITLITPDMLGQMTLETGPAPLSV